MPVRYNRGLWVKTIQSMKRVDEIKQKRQKRMWLKRMAATREKQQQQIEKQLQKDLKLVSDETVKQKLLLNMEQEEVKRKEKEQKQKKRSVLMETDS